MGAHPSPPAFASLRRGRQSSPLQQGRGGSSLTVFKPTTSEHYRARGSQITFVLSWRAKTGRYEPASSSLGVSREFHLALFPQGQSRPGLASQK